MERARLRLKLAAGDELEAEGSQEFVQAERDAFMAWRAAMATASFMTTRHQGLTRPRQDVLAGPGGPQGFRDSPEPYWETIIESRGPAIQLRAKLPEHRGDKDACLVLLAGAQRLLRLQKPTAAQIAKWLRTSGYPVQRVDRAIAEALEKGEVLASGSRRSRRYELSAPGKLKAFIIANELSAFIAGE